MKRLENKIAVIYSNGTIGGSVAKAFAKEGAKIFLAGRTEKNLHAIAKEVTLLGGNIKTKKLDSLDEKKVSEHFDEIIKDEGKVDISFNAIGISQIGIQGIPLINLSLESFFLPIKTYLQSHFITSRKAASHMSKQHDGVILAHIPNASRISPPFVGGMVPAWAGIEGLFRSLSVEYGEKGVRSVCLLTTGIPETPLIDEVWEIHGKAHGISFDDFHIGMERTTHRKRLTTLKELNDAAVFVASNEGSSITGSVINLTAGMIIN